MQKSHKINKITNKIADKTDEQKNKMIIEAAVLASAYTLSLFNPGGSWGGKTKDV